MMPTLEAWLGDLSSHPPDGYTVAIHGNGVDAVKLVDEVGPFAAIVDIGLPEMDGYEVASQLRSKRRHADLWLIALSGYGQAADRAASRDAGFDEHLVKPVQLDEILDRLGSLRR